MHKSTRFSHHDRCPARMMKKEESALDRIIKEQIEELIPEIYAWFATKHGRFAIYAAERDRSEN